MASFNRKPDVSVRPGTVYVLEQKCTWSFFPEERFTHGWPNGSSFLLFMTYTMGYGTLKTLKVIAGDRMVYIHPESDWKLKSLYELGDIEQGLHVEFERYLSTKAAKDQPMSFFDWKLKNVFPK